VRVLVTGATGYVGSHAVRALVGLGHRVRVLARRPDAVRVPDVDVAAGDVTDADAVRAAVAGCDAVVHCGSVYSFDARDRAAIRATNVTGTEIVLRAALDAGCDPVVHVSSMLALLPAAGVVTADSPPGDCSLPYAGSKADSERVARGLQAEGAPVVSVLPGWVWGPDDPRLGESSGVLRDVLRGRMRLVPAGRTAIVDVRDLAALLARIV
jgi:nucleoside-diphosphate-sugar epimerase